MAKDYELTAPRKLVNMLVSAGLRVGIAPKATYLLTVRGRKSGEPHSTPVTLVEENGERRWLVAPYGEVSWVRNARAAGKVTLSRGRRQETLTIEELDPGAAAPVLKRYVGTIPFVRPYFDTESDAPDEAFAAEARRHPVFRLGRLTPEEDAR